MGAVVVRDKNVTGSFITVTKPERPKIIASFKLGCMHSKGPNPIDTALLFSILTVLGFAVSFGKMMNSKRPVTNLSKDYVSVLA